MTIEQQAPVESPAAGGVTEKTQSHGRAWTFLLIAAVFEIVFALGTKGSEGFTQLVPSLITAGAAGMGIFTLSLALRTLDVGIGYAVWTGIGSVGTVIVGSFLYDEPITPVKVLCFAAIIGGVLGLKIVSREPAPEATAGAPGA
ncbi:DMT family transporter [Actinopolyspora mortivallis]|uniref:DMT family transporter n=1 Tax=Actinopolyspora mortivallis TaxID=33906 RepID=UPI0003637903|nr:multidrug efflux SMR transporter [Actinopolyspora mortivallis]